MNFNNINGVWPQIKDYIDSKLGGGVSDKYKHMIYIDTFLDDEKFAIVSSNGSGLTNVYFTTYYNGYVYTVYQGDYFTGNKNGLYYIDKYKLEKDDYMSYMGHIYDYQGNIVE